MTCPGAHKVGKFEHCEGCGQTGIYAFAPNVRPRTAWRVETLVEWVEKQTRPFLTRDAQRACGSYPIAVKTLRILEHHGHIRRVGARQRAITWETVGGVA